MLLPDWPIQHLVGGLSTTRNGGFSQSPFDSLNLGYHVGDNKQRVDANQQQLLRFLPRPAQWLEQVHGANVLEVTQYQGTTPWPKADAQYTRLKQMPLAIMTADCLPILLSDYKGNEVAAIHGGWRPLAQGIINNTLQRFLSPNEHVYAWLGPAIGPTQFEVGEEVRQQFCALNAEHKNDFMLQANSKYLADIFAIARRQLNVLGIKHIFGGTHCTVTEQAQFFSYRRDGQTGRMASLIWRK